MARPGDGEFISAKNLYAAGLAAALDMNGADPGRRGITLKVMNASFEPLSLADRYRALTSLSSTLASGLNP